MTWQIWLAIASIVFIVFGLVKRLETRMHACFSSLQALFFAALRERP